MRYLLKADIVSKNRIAHDLELTVPTVTSALKDLQALGLAREDGAMDSNGGRKSMGYRCNKDARYAVGVNIARSSVDLAIVDLSMEPVCKKHERVQIHGQPASYEWLQRFIASEIGRASCRERVWLKG